MRALMIALELISGLALLGLVAVLCRLSQWAAGAPTSYLHYGLILLAVIFAVHQVTRYWSERTRSQTNDALLGALRAYSEMRSETLNLCAGITVSLSLCSHYCFSEPLKIHAEINRLWGAVEEFQNVRLPALDQSALGSGPGANQSPGAAVRALRSRL